MAENHDDVVRRRERNNGYKRNHADKMDRLIDRLRRVLDIDPDATKFCVLTAACTTLEAHKMYKQQEPPQQQQQQAAAFKVPHTPPKRKSPTKSPGRKDIVSVLFPTPKKHDGFMDDDSMCLKVNGLLEHCVNHCNKVQELAEYSLIVSENPLITSAINDEIYSAYADGFRSLVRAVMCFLDIEKYSYAKYLAVHFACSEAALAGEIVAAAVAYELAVRGDEEIDELFMEQQSQTF